LLYREDGPPMCSVTLGSRNGHELGRTDSKRELR